MIDLNTTNPLTFLQWKQYQNNSSTASELSINYNNYLVEWKENKDTNTSLDLNYKKNIYVEFLLNLNLSTLPPKVENFLNKIDTSDVYELELAVHYYVDVIKSQLKNNRDLREEAKFTKTKNNFKISSLGIKKYLHNFIICDFLYN